MLWCFWGGGCGSFGGRLRGGGGMDRRLLWLIWSEGMLMLLLRWSVRLCLLPVLACHGGSEDARSEWPWLRFVIAAALCC